MGAGNVSGAEVVRALEGIGFVRVSHKGSHSKRRRLPLTVIVPMHREIKEGTLRSISRQASMSWPDFRALVGLD